MPCKVRGRVGLAEKQVLHVYLLPFSLFYTNTAESAGIGNGKHGAKREIEESGVHGA
jgi:hypothetical protein